MVLGICSACNSRTTDVSHALQSIRLDDDYPTFHLSMACFWCKTIDGELKLLEAEAAKWLTKDMLYDVQWLPADMTLVEKIKEQMQ